jgi:hypothetical protein
MPIFIMPGTENELFEKIQNVEIKNLDYDRKWDSIILRSVFLPYKRGIFDRYHELTIEYGCWFGQYRIAQINLPYKDYHSKDMLMKSCCFFYNVAENKFNYRKLKIYNELEERLSKGMECNENYNKYKSANEFIDNIYSILENDKTKKYFECNGFFC